MSKSSKSSAKSSVFVAVAHRPLPTGDGFRTVYVRALADGSFSYTPTRALADTFPNAKRANDALDALVKAKRAQKIVAYGLQECAA